MEALRAARTPSSPPIASTARRSPAASAWTALMAEMLRQARRLLPRPRRLDAHLRPRDPVLRRQRDRRRRAAARGRHRARRQDAGPQRGHRLLLRRRRGRRGRVPRKHEPRARCGSCRCCSCARTTSTRWAWRWSAPRPRPTSRARPQAYRMPSEAVDGMDVVAVEAAARRAVEMIRAGSGPYFLECRTYRFRAHSMFDAQLYRTKDEIEAWREHGPIVRFQGWLERQRPDPRRTRSAAIEAEAARRDRGRRRVCRGRHARAGRGARTLRH